MKLKSIKLVLAGIAIGTLGMVSFASKSALALSACERECQRQSTIRVNVCNHVAPANKPACISAALRYYTHCVAGCNE